MCYFTTKIRAINLLSAIYTTQVLGSKSRAIYNSVFCSKNMSCQFELKTITIVGIQHGQLYHCSYAITHSHLNAKYDNSTAKLF